jgi:hypothetical protein
LQIYQVETENKNSENNRAMKEREVKAAVQYGKNSG